MSAIAPVSGPSRSIPVQAPFRQRNAVPAETGSARLDVAAQSASLERSGSLSVRTRDGDLVTLSFSSLESRTVSGGVAQSGSGSPSASYSASYSDQRRSSSELNVSVEGQLDKKELSDISKLLRRLAKFIRGGGETTAAGAAPKNPARGTSTLAGFEFSYQETSRYEGASLSVLA